MTSVTRGRRVALVASDFNFAETREGTTTAMEGQSVASASGYTVDGGHIAGQLRLAWTAKGSGATSGNTIRIYFTVGTGTQFVADMTNFQGSIQLRGDDAFIKRANNAGFGVRLASDGLSFELFQYVAADAAAATITLLTVADMAADGEVYISFDGTVTPNPS